MTSQIWHRERRFIVKKLLPENLPAELGPAFQLQQGYFETSSGGDFRVRLITGQNTGTLTRVEGVGALRTKEETAAELNVVRFLLDSCGDRVEKRRQLWLTPEMNGFWKLDRFDGNLAGLVLLEFELTGTIEPPIARPSWVGDWVEVTNWLTNRHLARFARDLNPASRHDRPVTELLPKRLPRIVLTGGPCSGKSTAIATLKDELGELVATMPETATVIISTIGIRPTGDRLDGYNFQRAVYKAQACFEVISELQASRDGKRALITDRGTIDGAAFLTDGASEFEQVCRTTIWREYANYDLVIHLAVPPAEVYAANCRNNPARRETHAEAIDCDTRIREAWFRHPNYRHVGNDVGWEAKLNIVRSLIGNFLTHH